MKADNQYEGYRDETGKWYPTGPGYAGGPPPSAKQMYKMLQKISKSNHQPFMNRNKKAAIILAIVFFFVSLAGYIFHFDSLYNTFIIIANVYLAAAMVMTYLEDKLSE